LHKPSIERKHFFFAFVTILIIFSTVAYIATTPTPREQFFQLYVLDANKKTEEYYPNNDRNIPVNTSVNWNIGVTNLMDSIQIAQIRVKIGNQTLTSPNEKTATASELPTIAEFRRVLLDNQTWEFPSSWQILEADTKSDSVYITIMVNDEEPIRISNVAAFKGKNFRIIIELWTFDKDSGSFIFGWREGGQRKTAWLQLWFNATSAT